MQTFGEQLNIHERDRLSDEGQDYLRRMSDAAGRMRMLIEDLLTFSRVTTKGRPFADVDLGEVAHQVVIDLEVAIDEAHAKVVVDDLPTIEADRTQMRQLLQNLIANAIKFRRDGVPPEVHVERGRRQRHGRGQGRRQRHRLRRQVRARGSSAPSSGCTRAATTRAPASGWRCAARSSSATTASISAAGTPGAGAVFTFTLPVEQDADSRARVARRFQPRTRTGDPSPWLAPPRNRSRS